MQGFSSLKVSKKKFRRPIVAVTFENGSKNSIAILPEIDTATITPSFLVNYIDSDYLCDS